MPKPELNRVITVGLDGTIFLPLIGSLNVSGRTIDQLRNDIPNLMTGAVYRDRINGESVLVTISSDEVLVEIAAYRPIYVDGAVEQPGELPFTVGLTVRQAIAAAQGYAMPNAEVRSFTEDDPLSIRARLSALQAELAYYNAVASGRREVDADAVARIEVLTAPVDDVVARMNRRLENARAIFDREMEGLDQSIAIADERLAAERARLEYMQSIANRARDKVNRVEELALKGFATPDDLSLAWDQYLSIAERLRRGEERLDTLEASKREYVLERSTAEAQRQEAAFERIGELEASVLDLIGRLEVVSADADTSAVHLADEDHVYKIHRQSGDQILEFEANAGTRLMPGDVLNVRSIPTASSPVPALAGAKATSSATIRNRDEP